MFFLLLYNFDVDGLLVDVVCIYGVVWLKIDDDVFCEQVLVVFDNYLLDGCVDLFVKVWFFDRFGYCLVDIDMFVDFDCFVGWIGDVKDVGVVFYFLILLLLFGLVVVGFEIVGLIGLVMCIVMEKLIGYDLFFLCEVNVVVVYGFDEDQVFCVDYYLGKEMVQNLFVLCFGNMLFELLWNLQGIEYVQIMVVEIVGLEGWVFYYDGVGVFSDMVQNYMLQLFVLVVMELFVSYMVIVVCDEKVKVFCLFCLFDVVMAVSYSVKGQYCVGVIDGKFVVGYVDELGKLFDIEIFVVVKVYFDNKGFGVRWFVQFVGIFGNGFVVDCFGVVLIFYVVVGGCGGIEWVE